MANIYYVIVPYGETVKVRDGASRQSPVLFTLPRGSQVTRWGTFAATDGSGDQYYGNNTEDGRSGFVNSGFLTTSYVDPGDPWIGRYGSTVWKKSLHSGEYHAEVQNIQRDLYKVGYTSITKADGYYGTITETAVKNFQRNQGLTADGYCGNKTKAALWNHPDRT